MSFALRTLACGVALMLAGAAAQAAADPASHCLATGGKAQTYRLYDAYGHVFALTAPVCDYPDTSGQDPYGHAIVGLETLNARKPTMAALAYYASLPWDGKTRTGQPAKDYCLQLGAAPTTHGAYKRKPEDGETGMCMFEDGSFMEEWALFYKQGGSPRGRDLGEVLRFPNPF